MTDIQANLDYVQQVADWLLDLGDDCLRYGSVEEALKYIHVASVALETQNRDLASPRIESNLRSIANRLAEQGLLQRNTPRTIRQPRRCLHVISEALSAGGHTAMAVRWMKLDRERSHSLALLSQEVAVPTSLRKAVENSGGQVYMADPALPFTDRAVWLRRLAVSESDYVVLHIGLSDVICSVAFGVPGGPPVMLVNHAAHLYWNGASTVDQVVNCRGSKLEVLWSAACRGVGTSRSVIVPIPLEADASIGVTGNKTRRESMRRTRELLGLAPDALTILTVGSRFKYLSTADLDFTEIWVDILHAVPNATLLVIGFEGDQRWNDAAARVGNRIRTLGTMPNAQLMELMSATDLYVEAFPFGTTTALLEAGSNGVPVALAPIQSPPPYGTDGIALDDILPRPNSISDYKVGILNLCRSADMRVRVGKATRESILRHHTGAGWKAHLETAIASLPQVHGIFPETTPMRTPPEIHEVWARFVPRWTSGYENILEIATTRALALHLRPRFTAKIRSACSQYRSVRRGHVVPVPLLSLLLNVILPLLPNAIAYPMFRICAFLCRGAVPSRTMKKMSGWLGRGEGGFGAHQEYRRMREEQVPIARQADTRKTPPEL